MLAEIRITKATLYIEEQLLWKHLPMEVMAEGFKRGKAIKRSQQRKQREAVKYE